MLAIRLQRIGKTKRPTYRLVVSDKQKDLYGTQLEIVGHYNPIAQPKGIVIKADRVKYWLSVGAQPSATVHNLLVSQKIVDSKKVKAWRPKVKAADAKKAEAPAPAPATAA